MAKEYIERNKAIKELRDVYEFENPTASGAFDEYATMLVPRILKNLPTADVVEVVRCKDCIHSHWEQEPCHGKTEYYCPKLESKVDSHFYCALERRRKEMTVEKLKTAVANINAYLSESHDDDDTVTLTVNVIRSVMENYEELIKYKESVSLTDNEVIEAFEVQVNLIGSMTSVYLDENEGQALYDAMDDARLLIKRQKAEIERLQKENNQFADIGKLYSEIKAEAVKEFIDKLIDVAVCKDNGDGTERLFVSTQKIREVAKEMAGERQCEQ